MWTKFVRKISKKNFVEDIHKESILDLTKRESSKNFIGTVFVKGSYINSTDASGYTLFYLCCKNGEYEAAEYLLELNADPHIKPHPRFSESWHFFVYNREVLNKEKKERVVYKMFEKGFLTWLAFVNSIFKIPEIAEYVKDNRGSQIDPIVLLKHKGVDLSEWFTSLLCRALKVENKTMVEFLYRDISKKRSKWRDVRLGFTLTTLKLVEDSEFQVVVIGSPRTFVKISESTIEHIPTTEEVINDLLVDDFIRASCSSHAGRSFRGTTDFLHSILDNAADQSGRKIDLERSFATDGIRTLAKLVSHGHREIVAKLFECQSVIQMCPVSDKDKVFHPMSAAAICGDYHILRLLAKNSSDMNPRGDRGVSCRPLRCVINHVISMSKKTIVDDGFISVVNDLGRIAALGADSDQLGHFLIGHYMYELTLQNHDLQAFNRRMYYEILLILDLIKLSTHSQSLLFKNSTQLLNQRPYLSDFILPMQPCRAEVFYLFEAGACIRCIRSACEDNGSSTLTRCRSTNSYSIDLCKVLVLEKRINFALNNSVISPTLDECDECKDVILQLKSWYKQVKSAPYSLRCQCRTKIRRRLLGVRNQRSIFDRIDSLPLPAEMKQYLIYEGSASEVDLAVWQEEELTTKKIGDEKMRKQRMMRR